MRDLKEASLSVPTPPSQPLLQSVRSGDRATSNPAVVVIGLDGASGLQSVRSGARASNPAAVVIGLDSVTGLQTARILARRGVPVIGIAADPHHACCRTRTCREIIITDTAGPALIDTLLSLAHRLDEKAVLFPCTDLSVLLLSRRRSELEPAFHMVLAEPDTVEMLVDKARFSAWAEEEGLPVPRSRLLRAPADVEDAVQTLRFPCMLKPAVKTARWKQRIGAKAFRVDSPPELRTLFARCIEAAEPLIVQELVEGTDTCHYTCNCYFTRAGEPVVAFTSRKLRQWPPTAGEASLSEEVRNEVVERETLRIFRQAGYRGLGYAEIKQDVRTGEYFIIEPNVGRPTGRSAQAEAAGVELLYTQYCDALGRPLPEARVQRYNGVKWIWWRRDLQSAVYHWRRGELTLREWVQSWRGPRTDALFSWRDPAPFLADFFRAAQLLVRGVKGYRSQAAGQ
jgi:D-aspartate ligase